MKILFICANDYYCGTFIRAYYLSLALQSLGHEIVLAYNGESSFFSTARTISSIKLFGLPSILNRLNLDRGASPLGVWSARCLIKKEAFDIIHGFEYYPIVHLSGKYAQRTHKALYVSDWADYFSKAESRPLFDLLKARGIIAAQEHRVRKEADCVTVISKSLYHQTIELGREPEDILFLPAGTPIEAIKHADLTPADCRKEAGLEGFPFLFGFLGSNLVEEIIPFLEAFADSAAKRGAGFLVIGKTSNTLNAFVQEHGLQDKVIMTGFLPEEQLSLHIAACDVCTLALPDNAYNRYRSSNKVGYYMAAARPTISDNVGEIANLFSQADIGWPINTPTDIAEAMMEAMDKPDLTRHKGVLARELAVSKYSWMELGRQLEKFYYHHLNKLR